MTPPGAAPDPSLASSASSVPATPPRRRRRTRRRFWLLLALTLLVSLALYPPPWHAALRALLHWEASRRGWEMSVGSIEGGLFDGAILYDVHLRRQDTDVAAFAPAVTNGSDLHIARAEAVLAWRVPFFHPPEASWLRRLTLDGVTGTLDFTPSTPSAAAAAANQPAPAARLFGVALPVSLDPLPLLALRCVPQDFQALRVDCQIQRGPLRLQTQGARITAYRDGPGQVLARGLKVSGPGFENTLADLHGQTQWQAPRLTLSGLSLGRGVDLTSVTLDASRLGNSSRQLRWDAALTALSGQIRSQGTVNLSRAQLQLDAAGSFQQVAVRPLARLLGIDGPTDGNVDQGTFSFQGDPEHWEAATISLAASARDFRWRQRRWENLELAAVVVNRRAQVRKLELRQSRNQLSFNGECALPLPPASADGAAWLQNGFTGNIDADLDDLRALAQLLGPDLPEISGRMSINGKLAAQTGPNQGKGLDGYLNVEGSELSLLGAPLDFLRATLVFRNEELQVADLQATRATDYFTGKGTFKIFGPPRYQAELRAAVDDLSIYHPAYAGALSPKPWGGSLRLEWSGDGSPGAHSGAFRGGVEKFFTGAGPAALARPINLEAEGTYSPVSVSFRRLALKEGEGAQRRDALKLAGAVPWQQKDAAAFAAGRWLDADRPMTLRAELDAAPLDLVFAALTQSWKGAPAVEGQASGKLEITGPAHAPLAKGAVQFRKAALRWPDAAHEPPIEGLTADGRLEDSVLHIDQGGGKRAGVDWRLGGTVDLHEPANPQLDITLQTGRIPRALDNDWLRADLDLTLRVRGLGLGGTISGEARLIDGAFWRRLELVPAVETLAEPGPFLPVEKWLPRELLDRPIDLRVSADQPLRIMARDGVGGELSPDLRLTGTGRAPTVSGKLDFFGTAIALPYPEWLTADGPVMDIDSSRMNESKPPAGKWTAAQGALYFNVGSEDAPTLALTAAARGAKVYLYGPASGIRLAAEQGQGTSGPILPPAGGEKAEDADFTANRTLDYLSIPAPAAASSEPWADKTLWLTAPALEAAETGWALRMR